MYSNESNVWYSSTMVSSWYTLIVCLDKCVLHKHNSNRFPPVDIEDQVRNSIFITFYVGDPHIHPHISDLLDSRYTATKAIFDIVVLWYLADTCLLSALINAFYTSTTVIDFLLWTLKIKYVILFFIFYVGDDENTRADLMNLFCKWRHVRQNDIKCLRPLTDTWQHHWRISDWRMSIAGC